VFYNGGRGRSFVGFDHFHLKTAVSKGRVSDFQGWLVGEALRHLVRWGGFQIADEESRKFRLSDLQHAKNKEGGPCDPPSPFRRASLSLAFALRNYFVQLEDWQEHRNDDAAYDYPEEHNQQRLDQ